jgi:hypothetical protein
MDHLEILLGEHGFRGRARRVRCFAHTINLTAKATLRQFEKTKGKKTKRTDNDETPIFDDLPLLEPIDVENDSDDSDRELDLEVVHDTGLKTHAGTRVWVWWVRVRVYFEAPTPNPYPWHGYGGYGG